MSDVHRLCFEPVPRERWVEHPRFATQALLLGSHENFRHISRGLVGASAAEGGGSSALAGASLAAWQRLFDRWQWAMGSHEHYEEHKLYPFLRRRFRVQTADLEAGHEALHAVARELRAAHDERDEASWALVMARYDRVLGEHLRKEEDLVIPCLLALEPREFRAYYDGSAATALRSAPCGCQGAR